MTTAKRKPSVIYFPVLRKDGDRIFKVSAWDFGESTHNGHYHELGEIGAKQADYHDEYLRDKINTAVARIIRLSRDPKYEPVGECRNRRVIINFSGLEQEDILHGESFGLGLSLADKCARYCSDPEGQRICATGTVRNDGSVGWIAGFERKLARIRQELEDPEGVLQPGDWFLYPAEQANPPEKIQEKEKISGVSAEEESLLEALDMENHPNGLRLKAVSRLDELREFWQEEPSTRAGPAASAPHWALPLSILLALGLGVVGAMLWQGRQTDIPAPAPSYPATVQEQTEPAKPSADCTPPLLSTDALDACGVKAAFTAMPRDAGPRNLADGARLQGGDQIKADLGLPEFLRDHSRLFLLSEYPNGDLELADLKRPAPDSVCNAQGCPPLTLEDRPSTETLFFLPLSAPDPRLGVKNLEQTDDTLALLRGELRERVYSVQFHNQGKPAEGAQP